MKLNVHHIYLALFLLFNYFNLLLSNKSFAILNLENISLNDLNSMEKLNLKEIKLNLEYQKVNFIII